MVILHCICFLPPTNDTTLRQWAWLCSMTTAAVEQLLLKIGSLLEFAEPFNEHMPLDKANGEAHATNGHEWDERLGSREYVQAMTACAHMLLAECCIRSWPALASKVSSSFRP